MSTTTSLHSKPPQAGEQGAAGRRGPQVIAATRAVLGETQKGLWQLWGHRSIVLLEIISLVALYPFLQFILGNGTINRALVLEACQQLRVWQSQFGYDPPLTMSLNIAPKQFAQPDLAKKIGSDEKERSEH